MPQWVFFSIFALILTKAMSQKVFSLILTKAQPECFFFCPYSYYCHNGCFSLFFALILTKSMSLKVFSLFCPYSNQSPTRMVFFSIFALILTNALQKECFFFYFSLILTQAIPTTHRTTGGCFDDMLLTMMTDKGFYVS